ncbi:MAG: DUF2017 domain-containing protein [Rhodoglobus sp.]
MTVFTRRGADIEVQMSGLEIELLRDLTDQIAELLLPRATRATTISSDEESLIDWGIDGFSSTPPQDPALARLLPDAYRDDQAAASEHRRLTEQGLRERKVRHAEVMINSLAATPILLGPATGQSWLLTLTAVRLTVATRLQIVDDGDQGTGDPALIAIYHWLGYLQGELVDTLDSD